MSGKSLVKIALPLLIGVLVIGLVVVVGALGLFARGCQPIPEISGCAIVRLPEDNLSADFYEGAQLLAAGVNSVTITLSPGQTRRIVVQRITDNGLRPIADFVYQDTAIDVSVAPGQSQTFFVSPLKDYHKGQVNLTCNIQDTQIGDDVACHPVIDGAAQPDLSGGSTATYPLDIGPHTVHVELVGSQAELWFPAFTDEEMDLAGGATVRLTETFNRMTLLTITIDKADVVGDLFLDGKLIGDQVSSAHEYVMPNGSYTIIASNFADPSAEGVYRWETVGFGVQVGAEIQKTVKVPMDKQDLTGLATITCKLAGFKPEDAVKCAIPVDGGDPVTEVTPDKSVEVRLKPGVHTLTVKLVGEDSSKWQTPGPKRVTIHTGQTTEVSFSSILISSVTVTAPPAPTIPPARPIPTPTPGAGPPPPPTPTKKSGLYTGTLSNFGATARAIYLRGVALGRDPKKFSKVGDCETDSPHFLIPFDLGWYDLQKFTYLKPMITNFSGSFGYHSMAGRGSFVAASVLDPQWSDPSICQGGESPLACEYRTHNPSIALIMLRTYPYPWETPQREKYIADMRSVINLTIQQGIVPVVSTIPLIEASPNELQDMNNIIRQLSIDYGIPLWDFYATTSTLPDGGVKDSHLTIPPMGATTFSDEALIYGMPHRNLETLEVLHNLYTNVMR